MPQVLRMGSALALCLLHATASGAQREEVTVVRDFYARLAGGDLAAARKFWVPSERLLFERRYARIAAVRCMRIESLAPVLAESSADAASIDVTATVAEWHAGAVSERVAMRHSRFRLRRVSGQWLIEEWVEKTQQLADEIARVTTNAERQKLLDEHPQRIGPELGEALIKRALTLANERDDKAAAVNALARGMAEERLDDRLLSRVIGVESVLARIQDPPDRAAAMALADESVRLARVSGHPDTLLVALLRLMRARREASPDDPPIDLYGEALALTNAVEDLATAALVATQAAWYYDDQHMHRQALIYSLLAEKLADESGDLTARLSAEMNLGGTYAYRFDHALAVQHYERALALAREANFRGTLASILDRLAQIQFGHGDIEGVLPRVNEMLEIAETLSESALIGTALALRAKYFLTVGDLLAAEADLTRAQDAANRYGDRSLTDHIVDQIAFLRYLQGCYEAVVTMSADHHLRALALLALGRHEEAEVELRVHLASLEDHRPDVSVDPRQIRELMKMATPVSNELMNLLLTCGRVEEAFLELERRKGSVLRDVLAQAGVGPTSLNAEEQERLREIEAQLARLNRAAPGPGPLSAHQQVAATRLELADFWSRVYATHRELQWSSVPAAPLRELAGATRGITYLSFAVMEERTIVFVVSSNGAGAPYVKAVVLPIPRRQLGERVRRFARKVETRNLTAGTDAEALYDLLLRPVEEELFVSGQRICIIPDDELWRLPFHALKPDRSTYVAEKVSLFVAPSISIVHSLMTRDGEMRRTAPRLLAFGNTGALGVGKRALPDAEREVRRVARFYPGRSLVLLNGSADESTFKASAAAYDVVHVAAHALLDDSPMYSAVLLHEEGQDDGRLEAREIASMKLDARLVVISACESARGEHHSGEGVVGLPWALLATGARSSVVSLWPVDSTATARLMEELHRGLVKNDFASVSTALRGAQRVLLQSDEYSHPYYWAPFVAIGAD